MWLTGGQIQLLVWCLPVWWIRGSNPVTGLVPPCVEDRRFKSSYCFDASLRGGQEVQIQLLFWCLPEWWTGGSNPVTVLMPP